MPLRILLAFYYSEAQKARIVHWLKVFSGETGFLKSLNSFDIPEFREVLKQSS